MYPRLLINLCGRSLYRISSGIKFQTSKLSLSSKHNQKQKAELISTKFPDYKVVYILPYIRYARILNVAKYQSTILTGASAPVFVGLYLADIVSFDIISAFIASGFIISVWLHSFFMCNNLVGHIYLKLDEQKVIFSYLNYWGKRIDLQTTLNGISPLSDNPSKITDSLYKNIQFFSRNEILKINLKLGQISNIEELECILGKV